MQMYATIWAEENENEDNKRIKTLNRMRRNETENIMIIEFAVVCNEKNCERFFFIWILICKLVRQL